jgi:hypothetical protein
VFSRVIRVPRWRRALMALRLWVASLFAPLRLFGHR